MQACFVVLIFSLEMENREKKLMCGSVELYFVLFFNDT